MVNGKLRLLLRRMDDGTIVWIIAKSDASVDLTDEKMALSIVRWAMKAASASVETDGTASWSMIRSSSKSASLVNVFPWSTTKFKPLFFLDFKDIKI